MIAEKHALLAEHLEYTGYIEVVDDMGIFKHVGRYYHVLTNLEFKQSRFSSYQATRCIDIIRKKEKLSQEDTICLYMCYQILMDYWVTEFRIRYKK